MKSKCLITLLSLALITSVVFLLACAPAEKPAEEQPAESITLTVVEWGPVEAGSPVEFPQKELQRLPEITDGRIQVRVLSGMDSTDAFGGILRGVYDVGCTPPRGTFGVVWDIPRIPGLVRDFEEADKLLYGGGPLAQFIKEQARPLGSHVVEFCEEGFRGVSNSVKPIRTPSDLEGIRLRVPASPLYIILFEKYGAEPVYVAWSETYMALKLGTVDGFQEAASDTFVMRDVQKYFVESGWGYNVDAIHFNTTTWDNEITDDLKDVITDFLVNVSLEQREYCRTFAKGACDKLEEAGIEVIRYTDLTDEEKQAWGEMGRASWGDFEDYFGIIIMEKLHNAVGM